MTRSHMDAAVNLASGGRLDADERREILDVCLTPRDDADTIDPAHFTGKSDAYIAGYLVGWQGTRRERKATLDHASEAFVRGAYDAAIRRFAVANRIAARADAAHEVESAIARQAGYAASIAALDWSPGQPRRDSEADAIATMNENLRSKERN